MKKHFNIRVTGKVQGVFFRDSTEQEAKRTGITGIVRNEPDGSVYIEAEGEEDKLDQFLSWVREGPSSADVADVKSEEGELKDYSDFEVRA